jgi:hypothetical protein
MTEKFPSNVLTEEVVENEEGVIEEKELTERDPFLQKLWKKYRLAGEPPFQASPVENRLYETCKKYSAYDLGDAKEAVIAKKLGSENSEDYFSAHRNIRQPSSDASRRELHNQIALMTLGVQRSGLDTARAEELAQFACELVYGCSLSEAAELKNEGLLVERDR